MRDTIVVFPKKGAQGGPFVLVMEIDEKIKRMSWVQTMRRQTLLVAADRHIPNYSMRQVRPSRGNEAQSVSIWGRGVQPQPQPERGRSSLLSGHFGTGTTPTVNVTESLDPAKKGFFYILNYVSSRQIGADRRERA